MISLNMHRFISLLRKMAENEIILPVVADIIEGQISEGNIKTDSYTLRNAPWGIHYDINKNILYISPVAIDIVMQDSYLSRFFNFLRNKVGLMPDKKYLKSLTKRGVGLIIGAILYYGIHIYNKYQRGDIINNKYTKQWYLEFLYRSLYYYSDNLTTISRQATVLLYYPYLWLIFEKFEIPNIHGLTMHSKEINNILGQFIYFNQTEIIPKLIKLNLDQSSLDVYNSWFMDFINNITILSMNQKKRAPLFHTQDYQKSSNLIGLQNILDVSKITFTTAKAYKDAYDKINNVNVLDSYFPSPIFRELFVTSEPLAKSLFAAYVNGAANNCEDWQKLSAKGLSFLG